MTTATTQAPYAVIVGLGRSGLSCARYLHARGWRLAVTDTRAAPPQLPALTALDARIPVRLGALDARLLAEAVCVVASPGISLADPFFAAARRLGLEIVGDVELFARAAQGPGGRDHGHQWQEHRDDAARQHGAARRPQRARWRQPRASRHWICLAAGTELYVLELSSYQLETTATLHCRAATVLNVTPDHLDRYADLASYAAAKARIFARCDTAVINLDDPLVVAMPRMAARTLSFSLRASIGADFAVAEEGGQWWLTRARVPLLAVSAMKVKGLHNAANALAALALGEALALPLPVMLAELESFTGLPHRSQWVAEIAGVSYIDDSKGTNVGATLAAVAGMAGPVVLIAGGDGKSQDFSPLAAAFRGKVRHVVLIGRDAPQLARALGGVCTVEFAASLPEAVRAAARAARPGDTVLLSPACASLDMFRDYAHRGAVFAASVRELAA